MHTKAERFYGVVKLAQVGDAAQSRNSAARLIIGWQSMCLFVLAHLNAVFDLAKRLVSCAQFFGDGLSDNAAHLQSVQCTQRVRGPQIPVAATKDKLLGLREKLNLTNTARAKFDIRVCSLKSRPIS